jgi:hypothetical protein
LDGFDAVANFLELSCHGGDFKTGRKVNGYRSKCKETPEKQAFPPTEEQAGRKK